MESIISAVITGAITLLGVMLANGKSQAVTETGGAYPGGAGAQQFCPAHPGCGRAN